MNISDTVLNEASRNYVLIKYIIHGINSLVNESIN